MNTRSYFLMKIENDFNPLFIIYSHLLYQCSYHGAVQFRYVLILLICINPFLPASLVIFQQLHLIFVRNDCFFGNS